MKYLTLTLVVFVALSITTVAGSQSTDDPPYQVSTFSARVVDVRETSRLRTDILQLWRPTGRGIPLGHGVLDCHKIGTEGILGSGVSSCDGIFVLPLGKFTGSGLLHSFSRYTLVLTGGTGRYEGADGVLFVKRANGQLILVFRFR